MIKKLGTTTKYKLFIGMKDKDSLQQLCSEDEFVKIVSNVCEDYRIAFTMNEEYGGYISSDGTYVTEHSLVLSISGFSEEQIIKLAESLKAILNQESILISVEKPELIQVR